MTLGKRRAVLAVLPPPPLPSTTLALCLYPSYLSHAVWDAVDGAFVSHTPDLVLVSCGFDAGAGEQEGFNVTPACFGTLVSRLFARAGPAVPVVVVLEGGYEPALLTAAAAQVMGALQLTFGSGNVLVTPPAPAAAAKQNVDDRALSA